MAYLLFRVADTLEDSSRWSGSRKHDELEQLNGLLEQPSKQAAAELAARWEADPPCEHDGYLELLRELPAVITAEAELSPEAQRLIRSHTQRTIAGMASFVSRERDGVLQLRDVADLQAYCYAVAGIVGELLTELFLKGRASLQLVAGLLRGDASKFGEALQLVNILKDSTADSTAGRHYLPSAVERSGVFRLARQVLKTAIDYCGALERAEAPRGVLAFTALPVLLARATLDRVERDGPGAKLTRPEVTEIIGRLRAALENGPFSALWQSSQEKEATP